MKQPEDKYTIDMFNATEFIEGDCLIFYSSFTKESEIALDKWFKNQINQKKLDEIESQLDNDSEGC